MQANQGFRHQKKVPVSVTRLLQKVKEHVFSNCYSLIKNFNISLPLAIILLTVEELQKFAIISRLASNPDISHSPEMVYVDQVSRYLLLDFASPKDSSRNILSIILTIGQLIITLCYILPIKSQSLRQILSKFMVTAFQYALVIPSLLTSADCISLGLNSYINMVLLVLSLANIFVYKSMQFECSFEKEVTNVLVRVPKSMTYQLLGLSMIILFPVLNNTMYPISFLIYLFINLGVITFQWWEYLTLFTYFQEFLSNLKGVLLSISISSHICYLAIHVFGNAIISQNVLLFIITFSIFLANFFVVFRNSIVKSTIINQELKGEHETAIFAVFYWHCYKKIAIKKNQLYISSLLKKHTNECVDFSCCCKNRIMLYDANLKVFGNPQLQPHNDRIFIRHYIRRIIMKGCEEHTKSIMLLFLLIIYDIEAIEMVTHAMELIKKLSRMQQKKKLNFSERFLLFCMKQRIKDKTVNINLQRGNLELQNVKKFDQKLFSLQVQLRTSVKLYYSLWRHLNRLKIDQLGLYNVCKNALEVMFEIQKVYEQLKQINKESSELKGIMLFYSRMVVHDVHLLSQIRKQIKSSHFRNVIIGSLEQANIKIFGTKTTTLISLQNGKIRWSSQNAHIIFEYTLQEFHSLNIKNLMPKHFAEKHDLYIQKWKETGHHIKLNKTSYSWANNKDGSVFSMLMFVKVIPLLAQQDYAFFSCMEKLDDQNEIICTPSGQILGAGKLFPAALGIDAKILQEIQPNIQIFMPYLFEYFLQYFYPKNQSIKNSKQNLQIRREGYFPDNLLQTMQQITQDRLLFKKNYSNKQNFEIEYLSFVRQKMQELTCNLTGNYISFMVKLFKTIEIFRDKSSILCLKVSNPKRDNVERFYIELQKIINKLQHLTDEANIKAIKNSKKKIKTDIFKVFLNPQKVKQIKQKESLKPNQDEELIEEPDKNVRSDSYSSKVKKSPQSVVRHRKLLALGAQAEIKNERVKYNLWKIKKILHQQGVISRYTYNLLIGKKENATLQPMRSNSINLKEQNPKIFQDPFEEEVASLDDQVSRYEDDEGSQREIADKDNDNQTFNSASSSATFISMTNQVKMFKNELRSLKSPRPLLVLNILVIALVVSECFGIVYEMSRNNKNIGYGLLQFQLSTEANELISYLIEAQLNIQYNFSNISKANQWLEMQRKYFLNKTSGIFQQQLRNRNEYKQYDDSLLDFLNEYVHDANTLKIKQFFMFIIEQIIESNFIFAYNYFIETVDVITNSFQKMTFTSKITTSLFAIFISYLLLNLCFLLSTFPIVYKIQLKIKEIYSLLTKISPNQKYKFHKHYHQLDEQFRKYQQIDHQQLSNILANYQNKTKLFKHTQAISEQEREVKSEVDLKWSKKKQKEAKGLSADRSIYAKIVGIYLILFTSIIFYYAFNNHFIEVYKNAILVFSQVFNHKALLSQSFSSCIYQIEGLNTSIGCQTADMQIVSSIYNTLHLPDLSQKYINYTTNFVNGTVCSNVTELTYFTNSFNEKQLQNICNSINNRTFSLGAINNLYYCLRKIEAQYNKFSGAIGSGNSSPYLSSSQFFELNQAFFLNTFFISKLFEQVHQQVTKRAQYFKMFLTIGSYVCLSLIILFYALWIYIFLRLSESASYINAFLLLIPFDVLSKNPYLKLYVKNEFDYKSSSY